MSDTEKQSPPIGWKAVSLTNLVAIVTLFGAGAVLHDRVYDGRYALASDVMTVAQATQIQRKVDDLEASTRQSETSTNKKLDELTMQVSSIKVQSAVTVVSSLQQEYDRHLRNEKPTLEWREERDRLKRQLQKATEYRNCLLEERRNCDHLL